MDNKRHWPHGLTKKRLEKVKDAVLSNDIIMGDLLLRHRGNELGPEELEREDKFQFDHAIGNFACSVLYKMMDMNIIKK